MFDWKLYSFDLKQLIYSSNAYKIKIVTINWLLYVLIVILFILIFHINDIYIFFNLIFIFIRELFNIETGNLS